MADFYRQVSVAEFVLLMLAMQVKHLMADFILQPNWMARGKNRAQAWFVPLAAHAGLHGIGTFVIAISIEPALWWLGPIDFAIHGGIDRAKALVGQRWHLPTTDIRFWWMIGLDQFLHHLTDLGLVLILILM